MKNYGFHFSIIVIAILIGIGIFLPNFIQIGRQKFIVATLIPIFVEIVKIVVLKIVSNRKKDISLLLILGTEAVRFFIILVLLFLIIKPQIVENKAASIMYCISFLTMQVVAAIGNKCLVNK